MDIICIKEEGYLEYPIYGIPYPSRITLGKSYEVLDENLNYYIILDNQGDSNAFLKTSFQDKISYMRNSKIDIINSTVKIQSKKSIFNKITFNPWK